MRTLLAPLRRPQPAVKEQEDVASCFDLLDIMERGLSREMTQDFMEPLPDARGLWKFHVERAADRRQYRLFCDGGSFLMYARLTKDMQRVGIFMYDPCEKEHGFFDPDRPAFSLACNAARTEWRLCQERCDACRHARADFVCSCGGRQEIMRVRHSSASVGDGVNHCMSVRTSPQAQAAAPGQHEEHRLVSKMPVWNEQVDSLVLDFKGRNITPSAKNFQLARDGDDRGRVICQYGKISNDRFSLDFRFPLTVVQAFGLSLTTLFWT